MTFLMLHGLQVLSARRLRAASRPVHGPSLGHDGPADATARRLYLARCVVGALTGVLLLLALGAYVMGDVSRTFSDLDQCAVFLLAAVSCALAARADSGAGIPPENLTEILRVPVQRELVPV